MRGGRSCSRLVGLRVVNWFAIARGRFPATLIAPVPRPGPRAGPRATATGARCVYLPRARRAHATSGASGPSVRAARRDRALAGGPGVRAPAGRLAPPPVASPAVAPRPCARWRASPSRPPTPKLFLLQPTALSATAREASSLDARALYRLRALFIPPANPPHVLYTRLHNPLIIYVSTLNTLHNL